MKAQHETQDETTNIEEQTPELGLNNVNIQ